MILDIERLRKVLNELMEEGLEFFDRFAELSERSVRTYYSLDYPNLYWNELDEAQKKASRKLQSNLINSVKMISNCITYSPLLTEADQRGLSLCAKSLRSALRFRKYYAWDTEILHDEGIVLGIKPSGQSDDEPMLPKDAQSVFKNGIIELLNLVDLIEIEPRQRFDAKALNPQVTVQFEMNTAFIMMQIDASKPELEDLYNTYKQCFQRFGIASVRADEIEHQEVITQQIIEKIKRSEFLLADLTGERPSVYYEIGFAHALGRKVILYRDNNTNLHFDLAGYNCPNYKNLTELQEKLMRRLESMTNRKPT